MTAKRKTVFQASAKSFALSVESPVYLNAMRNGNTNVQKVTPGGCATVTAFKMRVSS